MYSAIVILNYNDGKLTYDYVKRIEKYNTLDYIVVVDNCSTDSSLMILDRLEEECPKVIVLSSDNNKGYAAGNNIGLRYLYQVQGSDGIVFISNPDIEIGNKVFDDLQIELSNNDNLFAATGLVHNAKGNIIPICMWKLPTLGTLFVNSSTIIRNIMHRFFGYGTKYKFTDEILKRKFVECDAIPGCFFACKLKEMHEIGYFDENTFLFFEEDILFSRAKEKGYAVGILPHDKIIHMEGVSIKKSLNSWKKRELILEDSAIVYIKKCLHFNSFVCGLYKMWNRFWLPERFLFYRITSIQE